MGGDHQQQQQQLYDISDCLFLELGGFRSVFEVDSAYALKLDGKRLLLNPFFFLFLTIELQILLEHCDLRSMEIEVLDFCLLRPEIRTFTFKN